MKRVYKCDYCYLQDAKPCYECSACMSGDDHFRPAKPEKNKLQTQTEIRYMKDEELSQFLYLFRHNLKEWLKQPAE